MAEEAARLKRLTADLSLLARTQESALDLTSEVADLGELAAMAADTRRPQYDAKGVTLECQTAEVLAVWGDDDRLTQAVVNVVGNALTHTPAGGTVAISDCRDEQSCWLEVRDTGRGIPQEELEAIFERFTRLDSHGAGIGIGLNIARTIVRAHGGEITALSAGIGTGATFRIRLPLRGITLTGATGGGSELYRILMLSSYLASHARCSL